MSADRKLTNLSFIEPPVGVLGVGVEGRATLDFLLRRGIGPVTAFDQNEIAQLPAGIEAIFGAKHDRDLARFKTIFRSPSVRPDHPELVRAREEGTVVTSAIDAFLSLCPGPVIGVTGTVGKGTATSLMAAMLQRAGIRVHLGGNIGLSPLEFLDDVRANIISVLEISSFQAYDVTASPKVGVVLRTTSEHLDWHLDLEEYRRAKSQLFAHQEPSDWLIYHADSDGAPLVAQSSTARKVPFSIANELDEGLFLKGSRFVLRLDGRERELPVDLDEVRLPGRFNLENVAAASLATHLVGADIDSVARAAEEFEGLPHRLEFVVEGGGIRYYNDSYATRPEAALGALSCFPDGPLALVMGGSEKHADFGALAREIAAHQGIAHVALIGATARRLGRSIEEAGGAHLDLAVYDDLEQAMEGARDRLAGGGAMLLIPACASFGLFPNYKVRGERFRAKATELANRKSTAH